MANMTFKTNLLPNSTTLEYSLGSENQPWKINGYNIEDTYVHISGDTMLGLLKTKGLAGTENIDYGEVLPTTAVDGLLFFLISNGYTYELPQGGTSGLALIKNSNNDRDVIWADNVPSATKATQDKNGLLIDTGYLKLTGGIIAGNIEQRMTNVDASKTNNNVSETLYPTTCWATDINGKTLNRLETVVYSDGRIGGYWYCRNYNTSGTLVAQKGINMYLDKNGTMTYSIADAANFRSALGLGSHATDSTAYVTVSTAQTISGVKTFSSLPILNAGFSWPAAANVACTGNDSEWSFDMIGTNSYWHVWSGTNSASCLLCFNSDRHSWAYKLYGAVWNDYAEYRETKETIEPGRCIREIGDDTLELTTDRLQAGCEIVSDTFGFAIGQSKKNNTPTATVGRVLAYPYEDREEFRKHIGEPVCSGPNGTVSIMTKEEEMTYPSRIIGTISAVPDYKEWQCGDEKKPEFKKVNGRIWIRVR